MNIHEIMQLLPHRYPILLVDRVVEIEVPTRIVALKNVTINEPYFMGHFPHYPVMPGVLIVEAMAQAAAILGFSTISAADAQKTLFYFAGIDSARFKRPVAPGDQLRLEANFLRAKAAIGKYACRALVDGQVVCEAELMCAMRRMPAAGGAG
ncbi:MAG: 3-hydroxyacyl-ACP dehydratase FabZ [Betaproteobacteria bacterium]